MLNLDTAAYACQCMLMLVSGLLVVVIVSLVLGRVSLVLVSTCRLTKVDKICILLHIRQLSKTTSAD